MGETSHFAEFVPNVRMRRWASTGQRSWNTTMKAMLKSKSRMIIDDTYSERLKEDPRAVQFGR